MPAFVRDAGTWKESIPFARNGSAWTDEDDQLHVRDGGEWKLIYPDPADAGDLLPVEGLAVTSGPNHFSVTIGWTNPTQPTITPTAVQVRIAELGAVWTELDYPVMAYAWSALDASTEYFAQVRLIRRVDGIVTDVSPVKSVQFTTTAAPIGAPAEDPGSPGGTSTTFPLGGSTGNPTAPSTPDGCWWEWKLQILDQDTTTINWQDTGITGTEDGDAEDITYDTTSLDNTRTYRLCIREACDTDSDGTADDFGDWSCSAPFAGAFDWGVTCGSVPLAPVVELDAAADAVWAFPRYCAVGDGLDTTGIVDAISNTQVGKGADFAAIYTTTDGEWGVVADADGGITLTAGLAAISTNVGAGLDFTIVARRRLSPGHSFSNGRTTTIASIGGGAIVIQAVETATGWYPTASFRLTSGYVTLSGSGDEITTKGDVHTIALRWDADGDKKLALDGTDVDSDTSGDDLHASVTVQPMYWTAEVGLGSTMQQIGWDRVISDSELAGFSVGPRPTFVGVSGWLDPTLTITGLQEGDFLVMASWPWNMSPDPPTGWTKLVNDLDSQTFPRDFCYKFADATDVASGWAEPGVRRCIAWAFRNVDPVDPIEQIVAQGEADPIANGDLSGTFPPMTASLINSLAFYMLFQGDNAQTDGFAGDATEVSSDSVNVVSQAATVGAATAPVDAAVVSGATWSCSLNGLKESLQFILKPTH